jgi:hypothetical protein
VDTFRTFATWLTGGAGLEPTDAEAKLVTSEGSGPFEILAEPRSQLVQFVGVGARDILPLQRLRCCLKDSLLNMTILVFAADNESDVFASFQRIMALEDEAFVLGLDKGEASGNAGQDSAHAASDDLPESLDERQFFLVECGVFRYGVDDVWRVPFLQLEGDVADEEFVVGNGQAVLGIEVREVREFVDELSAQARVREDFPITVALAALHERPDE